MKKIDFLRVEGVCVRARFPLAAVALAVATLSQTVAAHEAHMATTVVTAARIAQPLATVTADMTVIDTHEIERAGAVGVADVLQRVPGVQINRNGGPGQTTSVYLRGTSNQHALLLIDGVRLGSQELQGGAQWETLPLAHVERIEVLRGPAAAVYGSDAMGGVVQIFTKKSSDAVAAPYAEIGLGTHDTRKASAGISGGANGWDYALHMADVRSDGFDVYPGNLWSKNPDKDGYANSSANAHMGYRQGSHAVQANLRHSRLKTYYDTSAAPFNDYDTVKTTGASWKWSADWSRTYRTAVQLSRTNVDTERSTANPESLKGRSDGLLWQNIWKLDAHQLNVDYERTQDRLDTQYAWTQNTNSRRELNALALGWGYTNGAHSVKAHARHDDVKNQQSKTTGGVGYGLQINDRLRWIASAGTAFRTPTLYERFTGQAAADLRPESSRNLETGLYFVQGHHKLSAVLYRNQFKDLITYDWSSSTPCNCYRNVSKAQMTGVTIAGATRLAGVNWGASVDLLQPKDLDSNKILTHRAKRSLKLHADTQVSAWTVGGEAQFYSQRQSNAANTEQLPGYGVLNLYVERAIAKDWSILARIDNVANKDYQLSKGYATAGRTFFASLKWTPR